MLEALRETRGLSPLASSPLTTAVQWKTPLSAPSLSALDDNNLRVLSPASCPAASAGLVRAMIAIRRLAKRFSQQSLSEVKPAPLSRTVDHTAESPLHQAFQPPSPSPSPATSEDEESEESEGEESTVTVRQAGERSNRRHVKQCKTSPPHRELLVTTTRVSSAEKRKYSQYKCSTDGSSSASSSDDEVKEAFESCLPSSPPGRECGHTPWCHTQRPIRVPSSGSRRRVPKYFAQMASSPVAMERPRLDFNKMQSKRYLMVRKPVVLRHNYPRSLPIMRPSLELSLDFTSHSLFQPVPTPVT